ncbi:MAG: family 10 glycosylhydrolase, partial [bacterium]
MKHFLILLFTFFSLSSCAQQKVDSIHGTWITNVASEALRSEKNIKEAVALCKQKGLNNIYVVVWNGGVTMYPSKVVESYIGIKQHPVYKGFD